jgi:predicted PurR-regulated permease PerM
MSEPVRNPEGAARTPGLSPIGPTTADAPGGGIRPAHPQSGERRQRAMGWRSKDIARTAALVMLMYVILRLLWFANQLFLTAFLGVLFGLAVSTGVDFLQRFKIPRGIAAALIVLTFIGSLVGFGAWMAPTIREQGAELRRRLPESLDRLESWVDKHQGGLLSTLLGNSANQTRPDSTRASDPQAANVPAPAVAGSSTQPGTSPTVASAAPQRDSVRVTSAAAPADSAPAAPSLRNRITQQLSGATRYLFPFLSSTIAAIGGVLIIIFLSIYIGADPELYHRGLMHLFPKRSRKRAGEVLSAMATVLRRWLVTQLIAMVAIGIVSTVVLLTLRVKAAFALGMLAGLFEFIPTVGPILSAVPAVAMGFLDSPQKALYVIIAYWGIQFLENHLLIPLLMKGGVDIPPVLTILSQALMALVFGFLGLMVAVPLLAAIMVAVKMLYVEGVVGDQVAVVKEKETTDVARA